jgi:hypothetical protein
MDYMCISKKQKELKIKKIKKREMLCKSKRTRRLIVMQPPQHHQKRLT